MCRKALASRLDQIADVSHRWVDRLADIGFDDKTTVRLGTLIGARSKELNSLS
jgi:serine/threonine-protein kinase HipA